MAHLLNFPLTFRLSAFITLGLILSACQPKTSPDITQSLAIEETTSQVNSTISTTTSTTAQTTTTTQNIAPAATLPKALIEQYPMTATMVKITSGSYRPLYLSKDSPIVKVKNFEIDTLPVTNAQFYQFVTQNPAWQKQHIAKLFTEADYLKHWQLNDQQTYQPAIADLKKPVVNVSWYAANAYCQSQGKKLPTVAQWEYVAQASSTQKNGSNETGYNQKILDWYGDSANKPLSEVGLDIANVWGVHNLHGLIWEWTDDYNSNLVTGESRGDSTLNKEMFCGSGAAGAIDPSDYAAFMRYGFRSSLQSKFALASLGFRCAKAD